MPYQQKCLKVIDYGSTYSETAANAFELTWK